MYTLAIILPIILILSLYWLIKLGFIAETGGFLENVDLSLVSKDWMKIPMKDGRFMHAAAYRSKQNLGKKPYVILTHGMNGRLEDLEWISVPLALNGFHVLAFNQCGHGKPPHTSPGNPHDYTEVMVNVHDAVSAVLNQPDLIEEDPPRIGFVGHSTGGVMAFSQAALNKDIKVIIALSGIHDFMAIVNKPAERFSPDWWKKAAFRLGGIKIDYTEEENKIISPKYCLNPSDPNNSQRLFMIHTEDDFLPIEEVKKNKEFAHIPDENCLFLGKGAHDYRAQEPIISAQVLAWFIKNL
jgi:serine aminopeptidase S33 family